jgi:two-component system phosphate regulon sensor histidine kinase PhoR
MINDSSIPAENAQKSEALDNERFGSLINSMGDGVIAVDEHFKVAVTNGAALNILDVNASLIGKDITTVLHLFDKNNQKVNIKEAIKETASSVASRDWKLRYSAEDSINLYTSIAPVRLGYGQKGMKGYVILLRDITHEKSLEEERDEFISVVSHELRTPITIAEGNISNARLIFQQSGLKNVPVQDAIRQAHEQINFLSAMINDLSMLSRAERGKLTVDIESINVFQLVDGLVKTYSPDATAKDLHIKAEIDPKLELLQSSKLYVREILQNFVTNALKYTQKGHIVIGVRQKSGGVEFFVEDTGIGINKADQEKVFDKFFRAENYHTRETSGTGLGLYVTMKLARLLHAEISLQSEPNKGSTFTIFIPNLK